MADENRIITAKTAGFCFGVERAIRIVENEISRRDADDNGDDGSDGAGTSGAPIYTYGPIIHNETVVNDLRSRGVEVLAENDARNNDLQLGSDTPATVIIRSHGVAKETQEQLEKSGYRVVDATCPFVKKIHNIVAEHSKNGEHILIIGNKDHPEVQGIIGWIEENSGYTVLDTPAEARKFALNPPKKICLVSQTTYNHKKFQELVEIINEKGYDICALNTICNATDERQTEARRIAAKADVMLVIGSKSSSNTKKLFEICLAECDNTYFIQTADDVENLEIEPSVLQSIRTIGITAGASTPNKIIEEVQKQCQKILNKC